MEPMRAAIASARYASFRCPIRAYRLWDEPPNLKKKLYIYIVLTEAVNCAVCTHLASKLKVIPRRHVLPGQRQVTALVSKTSYFGDCKESTLAGMCGTAVEY